MGDARQKVGLVVGNMMMNSLDIGVHSIQTKSYGVSSVCFLYLIITYCNAYTFTYCLQDG